MLSRIFACCATLCATGLTACSDDAAPPPRARTVRVVTVQSQLIGQAFSQTGEVQPRYQIPMSFRLEGKIVFRIENGTSVKAGDVLASVDKIPSSINVSSASAQVDVAKSDVGLAELTAARNWELFSKMPFRAPSFSKATPICTQQNQSWKPRARLWIAPDSLSPTQT